jgi:hypothetical protein
MSANVTINVMGTKEDIQKLWNTLCKPNGYGGRTGIKLDRDSIRSVEGTAFPVWEAKGEMDIMPEESLDGNEFKDLYVDFPALSIYLNVYLDNRKAAVYYGVDGLCNNALLCGPVENVDALIEALRDDYDQWKTLKYVPDSIIKTEGMCLEAVKQNGMALKYVPDKLKTAELCFDAVKRNGVAVKYIPAGLKTEVLKTAELCLKAAKQGERIVKYKKSKKSANEGAAFEKPIKVFPKDVDIDYVAKSLLEGLI